MTGFNPETLKQLLDQFAGQEEAVQSEIQAIEERIQELENQIEQYRSLIISTAADRQKIQAMQERYGQEGSAQTSGMADAQPEVAAAARAAGKRAAKPKTGAPRAVLPDGDMPASASQPAGHEQQPESAESGKEQLKNINDALRQLFR